MFESSAVSALAASVKQLVLSTWLSYDVVLSFVCYLSIQGLPKGYEDVPFYFWFNTSFIVDNKYVSVTPVRSIISVQLLTLNGLHFALMFMLTSELSTGCFYPGKSWTTRTNRRPGNCTRKTLVSLCSSQNHSKSPEMSYICVTFPTDAEQKLVAQTVTQEHKVK